MNNVTHTSPEFKQLISYLYNNLVSQTIKYGMTSKNYVSEDEQIAATAITRRWTKDSDKAVDDVGMFIATKQDYISHLFTDEGMTIASFSHFVDGRWTGRDGTAKGLCRAFINYMINQYHHEHGYQQSFEKSIVYLEPEKLQAITNVWEDEMISVLEDKKTEVSTERMVLRAIAAFEPQLTDEEIVLFHYWTTARNEAAAQAAMKRIGVSRRTFFLRVNKVVESFKAFVSSFEVV